MEQFSIEQKSPSQQFEAWKKDDAKLKELLEGSHVFTEPWNKEAAWKEWEEGRRFITSAIHKDGSLLDYGCANGFLLRSLQEWSPYSLDPYGFDTDEDAIRKAQELFSHKRDHFVTPEELEKNPQFPRTFDFVYWNVWDNWKFSSPEEIMLLEKLKGITNEEGRLILGLYDTKEENLKKIEQLRTLGYDPSGVTENHKGEQVLAIFNKISSVK